MNQDLYSLVYRSVKCMASESNAPTKAEWAPHLNYSPDSDRLHRAFWYRPSAHPDVLVFSYSTAEKIKKYVSFPRSDFKDPETVLEIMNLIEMEESMGKI